MLFLLYLLVGILVYFTAKLCCWYNPDGCLAIFFKSFCATKRQMTQHNRIVVVTKNGRRPLPFFFFSSSKSCARSPSRNQVSAGSAAALRSGTAGPHDGGGTPPGFVAHVHIPAVEHRCGRAGRWLKRMLSRCRPHPSELGVALRCLLRRRVLHYCNQLI